MLDRRWTMRGRPRGRGHSTRDTRLLKYLVTISLKHRIDPNKLFNKIVYAWKNGRSKCKQLTIQCREKMGDHAIFLITIHCKVVAQFPMSWHLLKQTAPLKQFAHVIEREKDALMKKRNARAVGYNKIGDLKVGMKRINLKARVLAISRPQQALTKYNTYVVFANATLTDETGTVKLTLWNGRIKSLSINDIVEIENANVTAYKGETQLKIGRHSKLRIIDNHNGVHVRELEHTPSLNSIAMRTHG
jgi:replication factor A1